MNKAFLIGISCQVMKAASRVRLSRPMNKRRRDHMLLQAHIGERRRRSLGSCGRPLMSEELKEPEGAVGHRRDCRLLS